jgi:hypothetical protein
MNELNGPQRGRRLLSLKEAALKHFQAEHWREVALILGCAPLVQSHDRLLRSLHFGDSDYGSAALDVLMQMVDKDARNLAQIEEYVRDKFAADDMNVISSKATEAKKIVFLPSRF